MIEKREKRPTGTVEIRAAAADEPKKIEGYAAIFNSPTSIGGWFMEQIAPGAFAGALSGDVRALFNHDENLVLGRTTNGTLQLAEDTRGLRYSIDPPDTQVARDLMTSIERGDVSQSSFAFICIRDEWDYSDDMAVRTVLECELFDVSPVTYPAYDDTAVGLRSLEAARAAGIITPRDFARIRSKRMALAQRQRGITARA